MLIQKAHVADVPVIYVQHNDAGLVKDTDFWQIHNSISPIENDIIVQKWTADSFDETILLEELKKRAVHHLVIAGNQTEYCIDATTRSAFKHGFQVTLAKDAHGTWDSETMSATQIKDYHNEMLSHFAELQETKNIQFPE